MNDGDKKRFLSFVISRKYVTAFFHRAIPPLWTTIRFEGGRRHFPRFNLNCLTERGVPLFYSSCYISGVRHSRRLLFNGEAVCECESTESFVKIPPIARPSAPFGSDSSQTAVISCMMDRLGWWRHARIKWRTNRQSAAACRDGMLIGTITNVVTLRSRWGTAAIFQGDALDSHRTGFHVGHGCPFSLVYFPLRIKLSWRPTFLSRLFWCVRKKNSIGV